MAIAFRHVPPAPAPGVWVGRIEPRKQKLVRRGIAGGQKNLAGRPGQFILVRVIVSVRRDLLVSAIFAILADCVGQELPAELGLLQVERGGCRVRLLERRGRSGLRQRSYGSSRHGGCFWPDDLRVTVVGRHIVLVFAVLWIYQEIEP